MTQGVSLRVKSRYPWVSRWPARTLVDESVATRAYVDAIPDEAWQCLLLYEEVPGSAPMLLRALLSAPLRTEGDKSRVGERVRCVYHGGDLVKRMVTVEPSRLLEFEVVEQKLGIEDCILTSGGSYRLSPRDEGTEVTLVTNYRAYLAPRALWRPVEVLLVRRLHRHIIAGVRSLVFRARSHVRVPGEGSRLDDEVVSEGTSRRSNVAGGRESEACT